MEATKVLERRHKQKGRRDSIVISILLPVELRDLIDRICAESSDKCRVPLNRNSWIKRAILRDLAHRERSRQPKKKKQPTTPEGV